MTRNQMQSLRTGDIIRHVSSSEGMVVTQNYGNRVTAVRTQDVSNHDEWQLVSKCNYDADSDTRRSEYD